MRCLKMIMPFHSHRFERCQSALVPISPWERADRESNSFPLSVSGTSLLGLALIPKANDK